MAGAPGPASSCVSTWWPRLVRAAGVQADPRRAAPALIEAEAITDNSSLSAILRPTKPSFFTDSARSCKKSCPVLLLCCNECGYLFSLSLLGVVRLTLSGACMRPVGARDGEVELLGLLRQFVLAQG